MTTAKNTEIQRAEVTPQLSYSAPKIGIFTVITQSGYAVSWGDNIEDWTEENL